MNSWKKQNPPSPRRRWKWLAIVLVASLAAIAIVDACSGQKKEARPASATSSAESIPDLMKARDLSEDDVKAALKTYTPTGKHDPYLMFASGGQSGGVEVIGIPSMRILKYIGVFTPEPWQGYGYGDDTDKILKEGAENGKELTWGDTHHPALSETKGDYDGQYLFINDKANARIAVISLKDFATKQIVSSGLMQADHGGTFVTPDTDYVIEGSQYAAPLGGKYAPLTDYNDKYRGAVVLWKFDRQKGRIDKSKSFAIELPPYMQDLSDAGKKVSDGWIFINTFDTERAHGGDLEKQPPLESGASQNDMDLMNVIPWRKAAKVASDPANVEMINGMRVIPLKTAIDKGILYFVPEPKSPHGVDVTPDGKEMVVSGKLDTHVTVYEFNKIKKLIDDKKFQGKDPYGVPILPFKDAIRGQLQIGLGPLHTQFDDKGNAYTSVFIESKVAKWSLHPLKLIQKIPVHYNVGHIAAAEGDTVSPDGKYLVSLNKWAIDRFTNVGPLEPQNFQLIDIGGKKMKKLYDLPIPLGEPHYAQIIKADKIHAEKLYPIGTNPVEGKKDPDATTAGHERIERREDGVHVYMTAIRSHFTPDIIRVKQGDTLHIHLTNIEQARDATHGFTVDKYNIHTSLEPGKEVNLTFKADVPGVFPFYCTEFCSALHLEMAGYLLVEPNGTAD